MRLSEYIGQKKAVVISKRFMESWSRGQPLGKAMLFFGPPGVGKSSLVPCLALAYRTPLVKHNLSRDRNKEAIIKLKNSSTTEGMNGNRKLIFLDECDYMTKSLEKEVLDLIKESKSPIILACNYPQKVPLPIRKACLEIQFQRPTKDDLKEYATRVYSEDPTIRATGVDLVSVVGRARSYRQVKHSLENGAAVYDADCYVEDEGSMTAALFAGTIEGLQPWRAQRLLPWVYDNSTTPLTIQSSDFMFAMYRRAGRPLGDMATRTLCLSQGERVDWPWSLRARRKKEPKKSKTEGKKVPTRGRGTLRLQKGQKPIDAFF